MRQVPRGRPSGTKTDASRSSSVENGQCTGNSPQCGVQDAVIARKGRNLAQRKANKAAATQDNQQANLKLGSGQPQLPHPTTQHFSTQFLKLLAIAFKIRSLMWHNAHGRR